MSNISAQLAALLGPFQNRIETFLLDSVKQLDLKTELRDACEYAVMNGGKRFRPALVLMIANGLNPAANAVEAAIAVEFFHTASLIADDLPCMDDETMRRNKPTVHKIYGETIALLASYGLIAAGYGFLAKNAEKIQKSNLPYSSRGDKIGILAIENASYNTGLLGATGGQFLDIKPPNLTLDTLKEVIQKKTVSLFEISFVLGWLYGGGELEKLDLVKQAALHFGMAFQIMDDIDDMEQDRLNHRKINMANLLGKKAAIEIVSGEVVACQKLLKLLNLENSPLVGLVSALSGQSMLN